MKDTTQFNTTVPATLAQAVRADAKARNVSLSHYFNVAFTTFLACVKRRDEAFEKSPPEAKLGRPISCPKKNHESPAVTPTPCDSKTTPPTPSGDVPPADSAGAN